MAFTNGSRGCAIPQNAPLGSRTINFRLILTVALSLSILAGPLGLVSCGGSDPEPERETRTSKKASGKSSKTSKGKKRSSSRSSSSKRSSSNERSSSSERSSSGNSDLEDEVADLLKEAKDSGASEAFAAAYRKANGYYKDARDEDDEKRAKSRLTRAKSALATLLSDFEELKGKKTALDELVKEVDAARKAAEEADAKTLAPDDFNDAVGLMEEAKLAAAKASSAGDIRKATDDFKNAVQIFQDSVEIAKENLAKSNLAKAELEAMQRYKDQAKEAGADVKAITDWAQAERNERQAQADLDAGRFQAAIQSYQQATASYLRALEATLGAEKMAKLAEENKARTEAYLAQQQDIELKKIEAEKEAELAKAEARKLALEAKRTQGAPGFTPLGSGGGGGDFQNAFAAQSLMAAASSFNAAMYKQELDAEDEEFLRENYKKLASSLQYDPDSGVAYLDLTNGGKNRNDFRDAPGVRSLERNKYLSFVNQYIEGSEEAQSFMANTRGTFLLPIPFKYRVKVEWDMSIQTMDANGTFNAIIMYNEKKSHYLTNWIHWQSSTTGSKPKLLKPVPGEYGGSANYWFIKTRDVAMEVEYKAPGADLGTDEPTEEQLTDTAALTVIYDKKVDPVENLYESSNPITHNGFVGFMWNRVKFTVKRLKITGILDKQMAVNMLRDKLGVKKSKKSSSRRKPRPTKQTGTELDSLLKPQKGDEPSFDF